MDNSKRGIPLDNAHEHPGVSRDPSIRRRTDIVLVVSGVCRPFRTVPVVGSAGHEGRVRGRRRVSGP